MKPNHLISALPNRLATRIAISPRQILLWSLAAALFAPSAWSSAIPAGAHNGCPTRLDDLLYQADFRAPTRDPIAVAPYAPKLILKIGRVNHAKQTMAFIQAKNTGECQAVCEVRQFERDSHGQPISLDLSCQDTVLGTLSTPATLLWADHSPFAYPSLRFGSWLQGYRHARLQVTLDRYRAPTVRELSSTPLKKAAAPSAKAATPANLPQQGTYRRRPTRMFAWSRAG